MTSRNYEILKEFKTLDISCLVKSIEDFEKKYGEYLFYKYIKPNICINGLNTIEIQNKITEQYKNFVKEYFSIKPQIISQEEQLIKELKDIKRADEIYIKYSKYANKILKTVYGFPNRYRCEFIIMNKHKLQRCKNKVFKDNNICIDDCTNINDINNEQHLFLCKKHINDNNIYAKEYYELVNKLLKKDII
jgi:hypothetical protein